jgi:sulfhydrogenase subunit beta (sulfur reductase)
METAPGADRYVLDLTALNRLIEAVRGAGYRVAGPKVRDGALCYEELDPDETLPQGVRDEQGAGRYRLRTGGDAALFSQAVGPHSWKRFLSPPEQRLFTAKKDDRGFRFEPGAIDDGKWAFIGVRPCDLAAIRLWDKVFQDGAWADSAYRAIRERVLVVAVQCTAPAGTCFCLSMGTGPRAGHGFDLALTEIGNGAPRFLVEAGTPTGEEILALVPKARAGPEEIAEGERRLGQAETSMGRSLDVDGLAELLSRQVDSPRWEEIAVRCLACGNCTMACPTCFCTTVEDTSDLTGSTAERWRRWDSCFTLGFSYIHGGSVRRTISARYRQWMTHKLATWHAQFGETGCVGCGRCITWCPAGIDITEEARLFRQAAEAVPAPRS